LIIHKDVNNFERGYRLGLTFSQLDETPIGTISFAAGDKGLRGVAFTTLQTFKILFNPHEPTPSLKGLEIVGTLMVEVNAYLAGIRREFSVEIDWDIIDGFQRQVLLETTAIPYGQVMTYGGLAQKLGKPGAARAVGYALAHNPMPIVIPCHRVIGSDRTVRGYIGGENIKAYLLKLEGHSIRDHQVIG